MEVIIGDFCFSSNFECGNLSKVVKIDPPGSGQNKCHKNIKHSSAYASSLSGLPQNHHVDYEFNLWTKPDCWGTEFENNNRTWFCFCLKGGKSGNKVQLSVMNLNKQFKLYSQGMQPVVQCIGDCLQGSKWERIKEKCTYWNEESSTVVSWVHTVPHDCRATYYAFTYPYSYSELQANLHHLDIKYLNSSIIYYHRELLIKSLDNSRIDLLTISSPKGMTSVREDCIPSLFPEYNNESRPFRFEDKKIVFISARVHPGETPSSYVLNGFINFLVSNDPLAKRVCDNFVFKIVPMLNPDGVIRGHYRTDQRGVNLNRVYTNPSFELHPSIFAAKRVILYHHYGMNLEALLNAEKLQEPHMKPSDSSVNPILNPLLLDENACHSFSDAIATKLEAQSNLKETMHKPFISLIETDEPSASGWDCSSNFSVDSVYKQANLSDQDFSSNNFYRDEETGMTNMFCSLLPLHDLKTSSKTDQSLSSCFPIKSETDPMFPSISPIVPICEAKCDQKRSSDIETLNHLKESKDFETFSKLKFSEAGSSIATGNEHNSTSDLFMYIDLHGHASKRGIFMYGNWFDDPTLMVENMLFPKTLSLRCRNFDYGACNFSERNMYHKDRRDGMSKEGSGRVAVMRSTGLLRSYTLECNYNTGRIVHTVTQPIQPIRTSSNMTGVPPKYSPAIFEDCGHMLGVSIYDLVEHKESISCVPSHSVNLDNLRTQLYASLASTSPNSLRANHLSQAALQGKSSSTKPSPSKSSADELFNTASTSKGTSPPDMFSKHNYLKRNLSKLPRLSRKTCWNHSTDAENQEPPITGKSSDNVLKPMKKDGSRLKGNISKLKVSQKKSISHALSIESHCLPGDKKESTLASGVCLTPTLGFKVSISDAAPKGIKKLGKKQRNKNISLTSKKLKTAAPLLDCDPIAVDKGSSIISPRSPLASVCEPQASQSSAEPCIISQPNSPTFAKPSKARCYSSAKRPTKTNFKSIPKSRDHLPIVSHAPHPRMKLLPKKVKKKVVTSPQNSLQWVLREPMQVHEEMEPKKIKIKTRKKSNQKSL